VHDGAQKQAGHARGSAADAEEDGTKTCPLFASPTATGSRRSVGGAVRLEGVRNAEPNRVNPLTRGAGEHTVQYVCIPKRP